MRSDEFLSPQELSDWLGIPLRTIYQWRYRGTGPRSYRVGAHVRYRVSEIEDWLQHQADRPKTAFGA